MSEKLDIDLEALTYFISTLRKFNSELETNWSDLNARWQSSSDSWRDVKKDQFTSGVGWDEVIRMMRGYLSTSQQYEDFLIRLAERAREYIDS